MFKRIQLHSHIFELTINDDKKIVSSRFSVEGKTKDQWTENDIKVGQLLQQEIFNEKYNWLITKDGMVTLPTHNILVTLEDPIYDGSVKYGGGNITSCLKETCPYCQDKDCDFDCPDAQEWASDRDEDICQSNNEELASQRNYNFACEAIESMVLGHAVAGVDIESAAYLEGLEAAIDAVANKF